MEECARRDTLEQVGVKLMKSDGPSEDESPEVQYTLKKQYEIAVGKHHYIAQSTRPDICHAVNQLSRFQQSPGEAQMEAAFHVMRYLRGVPNLPLEFRPEGDAVNHMQWMERARMK
jgi:hypothetical protein